MNNLFIALALLVLIPCGFSQNQPAGAYLSMESYLNGMPEYRNSFKVEKRTKGDIKAFGGNDYKIESVSDSISKSTIKKEIWAVKIADTLYLNGIPISGLSGYSKVELEGRYLHTKCSYPLDSKLLKEYELDQKYNSMFGLAGGAISGLQLSTMRIPIILDTETGKRYLLTKENVEILIGDYSELADQFYDEPVRDKDTILLRYLALLNQAVIENPNPSPVFR